MKYQHIVFDIDGTLINTEHAILHSLQDTLEECIHEKVPVKQLLFVMGITGEDALRQLKINNIPLSLKLWEENIKKYSNTITVYDGIQELLNSLSECDCKIGIVTSKTKAEFKDDFDRFGLKHYFKTIICADDTTGHKPSTEPLLKYIEISGAYNEQILYIGDSKYDSLCAKNAEVDFALAMWGSHTRELEADYFIETPNDLLGAIK
ncbi:HAD family hydrolase [Clostridioides difficile]|uniref:HAD family hydrolase n=1 Tax=Clostridioides difficile TaxID=1496 RepID=UPI0003B29C00|nr:HAD family hydrolase [Clostridioides difficile]EGT4548477.1 HAD family hydrolase [Clostridioides difficile]EGT4614239.1 HAD family hydrolase [Clostridioides difficile]EGT4731855.1 HAD family hydrolase [Clostridioides difficile]EGT4782207.1 HAD family hydrolase [Clostridioides difficile]EGT5363133.1 HAD family hydrolase [Clostridioides difficile]